jgi:hypothetical protein
VFDGSDCLPPGVPNEHRFENSTQMLSKALIRVEIGVSPVADFTLTSAIDPLSCPTPPSAAALRMYRRPLPAANTAFLSTVMWDGRENVNRPNDTVALIHANLANQANDATLGHAQAAAPLADADRQSIVAFETNLFNGQRTLGFLPLDAAGAHGGAAYLLDEVLPKFAIGANDVLGCTVAGSCDPSHSATFSNVIFDLYTAWETRPPTLLAASIGRGEKLFNTRTFAIDDVRGLNGPDDTLGLPSPFMGFCGTCHDSPDVGNHSTSLPIDIGITAADPVGGLDVARLPRYTFTQNGTGRTITVTDPGRGLISGHFVDLGKTKGPTLRGLAARPPYFHNGSARDLPAVVDFYDVRFHIGFSAEEKRDMVAFLSAL